MDWKYKHFHQERVFAAPRDVVTEAARAFMSESLGWKITDRIDVTNMPAVTNTTAVPNTAAAANKSAVTNAPNAINPADGFTAEGYSFAHRAVANLQFQSSAGVASGESGTRVAVELLVERASSLGFMLFDVGGYYNIQIRKWLDGIQWSIHQKLTGSHDESQNPLVLARNKPAAYIFNGCLVFIVVTFALYFLITFIEAVVGLLTGNLYLLGRGGTLAIHGIWARIVSALILMFGAFIAWRIKRTK